MLFSEANHFNGVNHSLCTDCTMVRAHLLSRWGDSRGTRCPLQHPRGHSSTPVRTENEACSIDRFEPRAERQV